MSDSPEDTIETTAIESMYNTYPSTQELTWDIAAESFIDAYYVALESHRATLASFYMKPTTMPDGKVLPSIVYNGNIKADGAAFQKSFLEEMPPMNFDIQSVDAHCLNPNYFPEGTECGHATSKKRMTILFTVSGCVKLGNSQTAATKEFSESFVLVQNHDDTGLQKGENENKDWLIQAQTFRIVV